MIITCGKAPSAAWALIITPSSALDRRDHLWPEHENGLRKEKLLRIYWTNLATSKSMLIGPKNLETPKLLYE